MTAPAAPAPPVLSLRDLRAYFHTDAGVARSVDGVSLDVHAGETLGVVGESGCGKSVTALSVLRLIRPPGRVEAGSRVLFEGRDLLALPEHELRAIRGNRIAMIFQEPMTALNPVFTVGDQIAEVVRVHEKASRKAAWARAVEMLAAVGIPDPERRAKEYPHQLSGGMRQRVMIAMALVLSPAVVIADEPTTALDVTIQAQILELLSDLQRRLGTAIVMITHDLGVIAEVARRVVVMYAGEVVEESPVGPLFAAPHHPYAEGLLAAVPRLGDRRDRLATIPGTVPPATAWPSGCRFRDRCPYAWERCAREHPPLYRIGDGRVSRCHLAEEPERRAHPHAPRSEATHGTGGIASAERGAPGAPASGDDAAGSVRSEVLP
ncbi:ABC transporter ATP-binding protein [Roseisolibacter sp. H3M3-2]|uniref:ABC transporter ATP-binding protein n=1 Tax=Roseisolibacter sp. H3M3-2 TaxID=3031323 RepID=UPI0023DC5690|nr:ABC transporter ATP-binding protein [Roseisolibacter sp. H3M3-2]MDF1504986.1 ABC transporter ATP-binding protein [Roseisolibacter sp. H3M3-2]